MEFILKWECDWPNDENGQYENDRDDPGGETKWGIDKRSHPDVVIRNLSLNQALQIYWEKYWLQNGCERMTPGLGEVFMNACVNCGASKAILWALSGDTTLFLVQQELYYKHLADEHIHLKKFLKGWLNRTSDLKKWLVDHALLQNASSPHQFEF